MRILIIASYNKNRFAPFVIEQADSLRMLGHEIAWFGVQGKGVLGYLKAIPSLQAKIREIKPDVIHAHYGLSGLVANMATRRIPIVCTYHGSDINVPKVRPLSKITMRLSAWNIFVSKRTMNIVHASNSKHCSLIPCGINMPQPWSKLMNQMIEQMTLNQWVEGVWKKGKKRVVFAGAFDNSVKDPELAQASVELMDNVQLVELKGYNRDQVNALMYTCDTFLMTSKTEGSPQVIKEAMACGCPIVSVDVGDVAERTNGVEGCYVVPTREPKDLAMALEKAMEFNGKTNGRKKIIEEELLNSQVALKIIEIYKKVKRT